MARIVFAPRIQEDLGRFLRHMAEFEVPDGRARITGIIRAIDILTDNPEIGWRLGGGRRELLIGTGGRGYIAFYRYAPALNTVFVLALRHQREAGYGQGG